MSESQTQGPRKDSESQESQSIRRKEVVDLSKAVSDALVPLDRLITLMQEQNVALKRANKILTRVFIGMVALGIAAALGIVLHFVGITKSYATATSIEASVARMGDIESNLGSLIGKTEALQKTARSTEETVESVKKEQDNKPQLELVPETDPVKAQRAPVKLRVMPPVTVQQPVPIPVSSGAPARKELPLKKAPAPVAEIPLTTDAF